ncbi:MAG: monovalent cation/H(+) antiporter subunit G [Deltaproteobacteria bacterium]|nr:monovalent cation/H(+) antiporter subunit G [Deltaproteobacteria bacterium]
MIQDFLCTTLVFIGTLFMIVAGVGILRMPDLFMRMSCTSKATTLGMGFIMAALAVRFPHLEIATRALIITLFALLTAPVAAHMIARAAYVSGVPLWKKTVADQLCNRYDRCSCTLESCPIVENPPEEEERVDPDRQEPRK